MEDTNPFGEIIGVVGDVKEGAVDKEPTPTVYYIHAHMPTGGMVFVVRIGGRSAQAGGAGAADDPRARWGAARGGDRGDGEHRAGDIFAAAFQRAAAVGFSLVSLLLAAVGIYGVLAYTVTERTREFGVRVALGAEPGRIVAMVLGMGCPVGGGRDGCGVRGGDGAY